MSSYQIIHYLGIGAIGVIAVGSGLFTFVLARTPSAERPSLGTRGLRRQQALAEGGLFATFEPVMRMVAGWIEHIPGLGGLRQKIDRQLVYSDDWLGCNANDVLALGVLGGVGMAFAGIAISKMGDVSVVIVPFFALLGLYMPWLQIGGVAQERFKVVNRSLPTSIDLASLCMGAGLDFPGALRQIAEKSSSQDAVLVGEIERILQELELGHTRSKALEGFAERVPTEAVRDFVSTVVQAEAKGTPLAEVLRIQARMLRMRRSVLAEEAAAKAAVMMMGPLMMIFMTVILLLLGPFVVQWTTQGL